MSAPKKTAIAAYWADVAGDPFDIAYFADRGDAHSFCWACRFNNVELERAHIVPSSRGGADDDPANRVLLCSGCHRAAPNTDDRTYMVEWIRRGSQRAIERESAFAKEVVTHLNERGIDVDTLDLNEIGPQVSVLLDERCSWHYGDGFNAATIAWALEQVAGEEEDDVEDRRAVA